MPTRLFKTSPRKKLRQEKGKLLSLASLCYHLQALRGEKPFFLGCREAGKLLGVSFQAASLWLILLASESNPNRILQLVRKGTKVSRLANEYRFLNRTAT